MSRAERRALVEREDPALPVSRQCRLLAVSRASVYRQPAAVSDKDLAIMALIDRQYLARPYYGSRRMAAWLATQGHPVNRKRVQRLMRLIGLVARPAAGRPMRAIPPTTGIAAIPAAPGPRARPGGGVPLGSFAELWRQKIFFDLQLADLPVQNIDLRLVGGALRHAAALENAGGAIQQLLLPAI